MDNQTTFQLPQPDEVSSREREDGMGSYLMTIAAVHLGLPLPFLGLIAAVIYHVINSKKSNFTGFHTYQACLSQIPVSLLSTGWVVWAVIVFIDGIKSDFTTAVDLTMFWWATAFVALIYLAYLGLCIWGAVAARKGRMVYFPFFGRLAFDRYFGSKRKEVVVKNKNAPPKGYE